jgi:hypothetical protein
MQHQQEATSLKPSHNNNAPLAIELGSSEGKGHAASSSTKTSKRKAMEGYGSSFLQVNVK